MSSAVPLRIAFAGVAAVLAVAAGWRAYADAAYREGLGYTDRPAEDVPGRLECYERAVSRAPRGFTYLLRAGQIHLARAAAASGGEAARERELAGERLRAAAAANPLDARARLALAQLAALEGDAPGALDLARVAAGLGPRHPAVQAGAVRLALGLWTGGGGVPALREALDLDSARLAWQPDAGPLRESETALRTLGDAALGDLLEASGGVASRIAVARRWAERGAPDLVPVLEQALRRAGGSR